MVGSPHNVRLLRARLVDREMSNDERDERIATNRLAECAMDASQALAAIQRGAVPSENAVACIEYAIRDLQAAQAALSNMRKAA